MAILTVYVTPSDAEISLLAEGYQQEGNFIAVNAGTTVSVMITKTGYRTIRDSIVVEEDTQIAYDLQLEEYTIKFDVYPNGTNGSTTIKGITLDGFTRNAYYNDLLSYTFEKDGYESCVGTFNVTGNETKRIVLQVNRNYNNPNEDVLKKHRDLIEMYPAQFTEKQKIKDYIKAVENPFFEKPDEMAVIGYIGNRNQDTEESAQFIEEVTADRKINQLVPVALTDSDNGEEVLTFKNFVASIKEAGNPTENQNKFLHSKQWSWCPLINIDMMINYSLYHWIGYDKTKLPLMVFKSQTNAVRDIIGKKNYTYTGIVDLYIGELFKQEYESAVELYDGMRILFTNDGNPEYNDIQFMVTGVGGEIQLIEEGLYYPKKDADKQDYYVVESGSADNNDWSLSNRWVHRRVLEIMAPDNIIDYPVAERPIICYQKNYELYNYGTFSRGYVDFAYDGLPSDINGSDINVIQGVMIKSGMKILFKQQPEDNKQLYIINRLDTGLNFLQPVYNGQNEEDLALSVKGDYVRVTKGIYAGKTIHYTGDEWVFSQQKENINQEPLYNLYDSDGIYVGSQTQYPLNNFNGGIIFDYYISDDESVKLDPYVGKRIVCDEYNNYDFVNTIADLHYQYVDVHGVEQEIQGYLFVKNILNGSFNNGWLYKEDTSYQKVATKFILDMNDIVENQFSYVVPFKQYEGMIIKKNGKQLDDTEYTVSDNGFTILSVKVGDEIDISLYADDFDELPANYAFELPASFTSNQFNENIVKFSSKDVLEHLTSILQNQLGFEGNANGSNNSYALEIDGSRGKYIIQSDNPILLPMLLENNPSTSVLSSISYEAKQYQMVMEKVKNLSTRLLQKNEISDTDYNTYLENLHSLDETIVKIFNQINLGKNKQSPFYNNGVAASVGEMYIPATPAYLGLQKPVKPALKADTTGKEWIVCHDGAIIPANHSVVDLIRLELENLIYDSIFSEFKEKEPTFKAIDLFEGYFRKAEYNQEQVKAIYSHYFINWAVKNGKNYSENLNGAMSDWKNWNWSSSQMEDGTLLKGSYRAIYKYFFDTFDPSQTPWEMFGFAEQPTWWNDVYGEAPYTSANTVLWDDAENGYIRGEDRYDLNYARKGMSKYIPVNEQGELISPSQCGIAVSDPSVVARCANWNVGDISDVEYEFMQSSEYRFALEAIKYILRPVEWIGVNWNTQSIEIKYAGTIYQQTIDKETQKRPSLKNQKIHNTIVDGKYIRVIGCQQWIVDLLMKENKSIDTYLVNRIQNLEMKLGYCTGAFYEKGSVTVLDDNSEIPSDNIKLKLIESKTGDVYNYSAVKIVKLNKGYVISGFDRLHPSFKALLPIKNNKKSNIEIDGYSFSSYLNYDVTKIVEYPYGYTFNTPNEVMDFLRGYQKYLVDVQGYDFVSLNSNGEQIDFVLSLNSFARWVITPYNLEEDNAYPMLILNPGAVGISLTHNGTIRNATILTNGEPNVVDLFLNEISKENISVTRDSFLTTYAILNNDIAGAYRSIKSEYEDILIFDCVTVFGDLLYNPVLSIIKDNLHISAVKAAQWDGSLYSPGYLNMDDGLIPNLEKNAFDLNYIFDVDDIKCQTTYKNYSKTLIGYAKTKCMQELIRNEKSMFDFYKGMIGDKGTLKPIIAMNRSALISSEESDIENILSDFWAFKAGEYGQIAGNTSLEFLLNKPIMHANPQLITYCPIAGTEVDDTYIIETDDKNWLKRNIASVNANMPSVYKGDIIVPPVGYVNLEDVDFCVANLEELNSINEQVVDGQTVFVVDTGDGEWNVVKKSGDNHYISMRYQTLLDAYNHKVQQLVYTFNYNADIYYTDKNENEIQPNDLVYSDINLTNAVGSYNSIGLYEYTGKTVKYDAENAYKAKLFNTVFKTTAEYDQINKDSLFYCYADGKNYTYSNLAFKVGSVISDDYNIKQHKFILNVNSDVDGIVAEINNTTYDLTESKEIVVWVNEGTTVKWRVYAPHCEEISSEYNIVDNGVHITANLRYKKNEYIYNSVGENRSSAKFENGKINIGVSGLYEVVMNGAGGGAGGGATYYKPLSKYDSNNTNIVSSDVYDVANTSNGNVSYLGTIVSENNNNDSRSAGQGGGAGGYIRCILYAEEAGIADIVVGKGGIGGQKGNTIGSIGTNGTATKFKFYRKDGNYQFIDLLAGGGAAGMGALTNQNSTGSTNEVGNYIGTGDGGAVYKSGNSETYDKTVFSNFQYGLSSLRVSGAGAAPSQNPDGFSYTTPLYNECGFGGRPQYMADGENGDNGRLQIKYLSPLPTESSYVPYVEEEDTYVSNLIINKGTKDYSRVYSLFVNNNWNSFIEEPVEFINGLQDKHYSYGDCVSYEGKKYFCMKNHLASYSFETEQTGIWKEYTNYKNDYPLVDLPFYVNGVIGVDSRNPYAVQIDDNSMLYRSRSYAVQGHLDANIKLNEYNVGKIYSPNDFVTYMGQQYTCINENQGSEPTNGAKYWKPIFVVEKQPVDWSAVESYVKNDIVSYRGQYYQALEDNTNTSPDVYWYVNPQTFYVKMMLDQWNIDTPDEIKDYFPLYYDVECTNPVIDDDDNFLDYSSFAENSVNLGIAGLADEIGTYNEISLKYISGPSWSDIQPSGNYMIVSGYMSYYTDTNSETLEAEKGTGIDYIYSSDYVNTSKIAYQYNKKPLLYTDITDTVTSIEADGYELSNGVTSIYVKEPSGILDKDSIVYVDEEFVNGYSTYSDYLPQWNTVKLTPNQYQITLEYPSENTVYRKNSDNTYSVVDGVIYMSTDGEQFTKFYPQNSSYTVTVTANEQFYSDKNGTLFTEELYLFDGTNYNKLNSLVDDVVVNYQSSNLYDIDLFTKNGNTYNLVSTTIYVLQNGQYISFFEKYFSDILSGFTKINYNSNTQVTNLFNLYTLIDGNYTKLTGDLYSKNKKLTSDFYFDESVNGDKITSIIRDGKEKTIIGNDCYYNAQCKGIKQSLNKLLTTRDEIEKIILNKDHDTDPVYVKGYELYMEAVNAGISPTGEPERFKEYVEERAIPYCKQQEEYGNYIDIDDLMIVATAGTDTNEGSKVVRHAKVYHYYFSVLDERKYLKLYQYNGIYYMTVSDEESAWDKYFVELGTEKDLTTFNKIDADSHEEDEIVNSIIFKNDGDILYIDMDEIYNININDHKDVLSDVFGISKKYTTKTHAGEKAWIKIEVLNQNYQFNLAGIEEIHPDNTIIDSAYLVNNDTDETLVKLSVIDPMQGLFALDLKEEVKFISSIDPIGSYSTVQNIYKAKLGDLWWDISKVKYVNYKQSHTRLWWNPKEYTSSDSEFKASNWLKQLNGSEIVINEWTKSKIEPEDVVDYITNIELDEKTKLLKKVYYYWKKNPITLPEGTTRHYTAQYIADKLGLGITDGVMVLAYADMTATSSSFILSNYASVVNGIDAVAQINFDLNKSSDSHSDWDMVREKTTDKIPEKLWKQLRESLIGERHTELGDLVLPDPDLPDSMKYGIQIRPRQSMIADIYEALRNLVDVLNGITLNRTLTDATDVDSDLVTFIDEPDKGYYNVQLEVEQYANLRSITDERYIGQCILVKYDENYENIWTIYRMRGLNDFVLTDWQEYSIEKFIAYEDLYVTPSIAKMGIIATVDSIYDMYELTANDGDIVKVISDDKWILYMKKGKTWEMVGKQDGLIKFSDALYSYKKEANSNRIFIDLNNSPYWNPNKEYVRGYVVKHQIDDDIHYYRCIMTHTSGETFDENEQQNWVEIFNETVYDYKKNEASVCLTKILEYFAEG